MPIQTAKQRENVAIAYGAAAVSASLSTAVASGTAGPEPSGGSPAYARRPLTWTPGTEDGVITATAVFNVPAGTTIVSCNLFNSSGAYLDGVNVVSQSFAAAGTYNLTLTYTQS